MFGRRRLREELNRKRDRVRELRERILTLERWIAEHEARERAIHTALAREREKSAETTKRADLAQNNFEWARLRLNQVEQERSTLLASMLKAPIGALEIERRLTPAEGAGMPHIPDALFEDVGDEAASQLGVEHDDLGVVTEARHA
jgi:hypothetical protein